MVSAKTAAGHEARLREWDEFWTSHYPWVGGDLQGAVDEDEQVEVLSQFVIWSHRERGRRGADLSASLSAVRWRLQVEGLDESALDSRVLDNTRKGGARTTAERRAVAMRREATVKLPAGLAFLDSMLARLRGQEVITGDNIDDWVVYVASGVSLEALARVGEIAQPEGRTAEQRASCDHMVRAGDVIYRIAPADGGPLVDVRGIRACIPYLVEEVREAGGATTCVCVSPRASGVHDAQPVHRQDGA